MLKTGTTNPAGRSNSTRGRPKKTKAHTTAFKMPEDVAPAKRSDKYMRYVILEAYEKYTQVFNANGLTREADISETNLSRAGYSEKFRVVFRRLWDCLSMQERDRLMLNGKLLLELELQKMDPMRHPDCENMNDFIDTHGIPEWLEEPILRGVDPSPYSIRYSELVESDSALREMISLLRF
ncbi:hypothetical protein H1R20_g8841, partial [Candolleomyces eurysporus]